MTDTDRLSTGILHDYDGIPYHDDDEAKTIQPTIARVDICDASNLNHSTEIHCLPPEMLACIFSQLNSADIRHARLTCTYWKDLIDSEVPLPVIINDDHPGNIAFAQRVAKKELTIHRFTKPCDGNSSALACPRKANLVKKMTVFGRIHYTFFLHETMRFHGLKCLSIGGLSLLKPLNLKQSIYLPQLQILHLNSPFDDEIMGMYFYRQQTLVAKNTTYFLRNIWCPNINEIVIDGDVDQGKIRQEYDWKSHAIMEFFEKYNTTLRKVLIGESSIFQPTPISNAHEKMPKCLKSLHFSFYGDYRYVDHGAAYLPPYQNYWIRFITEQSQLQHINIGALCYKDMNSIFTSLPITMRFVALYWNLHDTSELDMTLLRRLINLERLELTFDGRSRLKFSNFKLLKDFVNLKTFVVEQILISVDDLESLPTILPKLEVLYLSKVRDRRLLSPQVEVEATNINLWGISSNALHNVLWHMDELIFLFVSPEDFVGDEKTVARMNHEIGKIGILKRPHKRSGCMGFFVGKEPLQPVETYLTK